MNKLEAVKTRFFSLTFLLFLRTIIYTNKNYTVAKGIAIKRSSHQKEQPLKAATKTKLFLCKTVSGETDFLSVILKNLILIVEHNRKVSKLSPFQKNIYISSIQQCETPFSREENLKKCTSFRSSHQRCSIKKGVLKISQNSQENTCARPATLSKKRLWHKCFPVNFAKFQRTIFLLNTSGRLFL